MQQRYKVIFRGRVVADRDVVDVKKALATLMQARVYQIDTLFSGRPVIIKKDLSAEMAERYAAAFREAGAVVELRSHDDDALEVDGRDDDGRDSGAERRPANPFASGSGDAAEPAPTSASTPTSTPEEFSMSASRATLSDDAGHGRPAPSLYDADDVDDDRTVGSVIFFLIKLVLTLVLTGIAVAALVIGLLWLAAGPELFGVDDIRQLPAVLQEFFARLSRSW